MRLSILWAVLVSAALSIAAKAQETSGCDRFAWSVAHERRLFAATDKPLAASGAMLTALKNDAVVLTLQSDDKVSFALPPERRAKSPGYGAVIVLPRLDRDGIYQVTLSDDAWIDVVQDGRYARSVGSSGRRDCAGVRKSVRLELQAGPFTLQISGSATERVALAIRRIE